VQFGRGHIAGVDVRQQKKEADRFYEEFLAKRRTDEDKARDTYVAGSILSIPRMHHEFEVNAPNVACEDGCTFCEV
jgi:hypothetical protein